MKYCVRRGGPQDYKSSGTARREVNLFTKTKRKQNQEKQKYRPHGGPQDYKSKIKSLDQAAGMTEGMTQGNRGAQSGLIDRNRVAQMYGTHPTAFAVF